MEAEEVNENEIIITKELLDSFGQEISEKITELHEREFLIEGGKKYASSLLDYIQNDVEWNYETYEAIVKLVDELKLIVKDIKNNQFYLKAITINAISLIFRTIKGIGWTKAKIIYDILSPINNVMNKSIYPESRKIEDLKSRYQALELEFRQNLERESLDLDNTEVSTD